jgi:hypothetical protein
VLGADKWDELRAYELTEIQRHDEDARKVALLRQSMDDWAEAETLPEHLVRLTKAVEKLTTAQERRTGTRGRFLGAEGSKFY